MPSDFENVSETEDEIEQLKLRCAVLSELLWWKTLYIRISFIVAIVSIFVAIGLLIYCGYIRDRRSFDVRALTPLFLAASGDLRSCWVDGSAQ